MKKLLSLSVIACVLTIGLTACSEETVPEKEPMTEQSKDIGINIKVNEPKSAQDVGVNIEVK